MTEGTRLLANAQAGGKKSRPADKNRANRWDIDTIVDDLRHSREVAQNIRQGGVARRLPARTALAEVINGVSAALFPTHYGQPDLDPGSIDEFVRGKLKDSLGILADQVKLSLPLATSETRLEIEFGRARCPGYYAGIRGAASRDSHPARGGFACRL